MDGCDVINFFLNGIVYFFDKSIDACFLRISLTKKKTNLITFMHTFFANVSYRIFDLKRKKESVDQAYTKLTHSNISDRAII